MPIKTAPKKSTSGKKSHLKVVPNSLSRKRVKTKEPAIDDAPERILHVNGLSVEAIKNDAQLRDFIGEVDAVVFSKAMSAFSKLISKHGFKAELALVLNFKE
jgi:hypothetical protein